MTASPTDDPLPAPVRPAPAPNHFTREEAAQREIGHTDFAPGLAPFLAVSLLLTLVSMFAIQQVHDFSEHRAGRRALPWSQCWEIFASAPKAVRALVSAPGGALRKALAVTDSLHEDIQRFETALQDDAVVVNTLLPPVQVALARWGGLGNEKAYLGRDRWLYYRPDIDFVTGRGFLDSRQLRRRAASGDRWTPPPQPDPVQAILQFRDQLAARGIKLIVLPAPAKSVVQPEMFSPAYRGWRAPLHNLSYRTFRERLVKEGVLILDVAEELRRAKFHDRLSPYLETDTHWTPETVERVAGQLRGFIREGQLLPPTVPSVRRSAPLSVTNLGDVAVMLKLPPDQGLFQKQSVRVRQIASAPGMLWQPDKSADVLLLGDSFANIYSLDGMGWGESAGLAEQLSFELQRPLDVIARNDSGAFATREILSRELAKGIDRLAGKKLVIWEFAMRELAFGDWKLLPMELGHAVPTRFFVPPRGREITVTGVIESISAAPKPGSVPYQDHLIAAHLTELETRGETLPGNAAIVYLWSMKENVWTAAARWRPGQKVTLKLRPWSDVSGRLERINRSELTNEALQLEEPCWGEWEKQ